MASWFTWKHELLAKLTLHLILNTICVNMIANNSFKSGYATAAIMAKDFLFSTPWTKNEVQKRTADLMFDIVLYTEMVPHGALMAHELQEQRQVTMGGPLNLQSVYELIGIICVQVALGLFFIFRFQYAKKCTDQDDETDEIDVFIPTSLSPSQHLRWQLLHSGAVLNSAARCFGFFTGILGLAMSTGFTLSFLFTKTMPVDQLLGVVLIVKICALMIGGPDDPDGIRALQGFMGTTSLSAYLLMSLADVKLLSPEDFGQCVEKCPYCTCDNGVLYILQMRIDVCNSTALELYSKSLPSYQNFSVVNRSNPEVQASLWSPDIYQNYITSSFGDSWFVDEKVGRCARHLYFENDIMGIFIILVVVIILVLVMTFLDPKANQFLLFYSKVIILIDKIKHQKFGTIAFKLRGEDLLVKDSSLTGMG
jgi:hypothetical protein